MKNDDLTVILLYSDQNGPDWETTLVNTLGGWRLRRTQKYEFNYHQDLKEIHQIIGPYIKVWCLSERYSGGQNAAVAEMLKVTFFTFSGIVKKVTDGFSYKLHQKFCFIFAIFLALIIEKFTTRIFNEYLILNFDKIYNYY